MNKIVESILSAPALYQDEDGFWDWREIREYFGVPKEKMQELKKLVQLGEGG